MTVQIQQSMAPVVNATTGLWTYLWPPISQGQAAQVSVSVPASPASATWSVFLGAQQVATVGGSLTAGPFTVGAGQALSLTGTPGSSVTPTPAVMMGQQGNPEDFPPVTPLSPGASSVPAASAPITLVQPTAGVEWQYILPTPGRLLAIQAVLVCSAAVANRAPTLVVPSIAFAPMTAAALVGGSTTLLYGYPVGPTTPVVALGNAGGTPVWNFSFFLNALLSIGTAIESLTTNLQSGDQWEDITLTFATV